MDCISASNNEICVITKIAPIRQKLNALKSTQDTLKSSAQSISSSATMEQTTCNQKPLQDLRRVVISLEQYFNNCVSNL